MKKQRFTRILAMLLAVVLLCGTVLPAAAAEPTTVELDFTETDSIGLDRLGQVTEVEGSAAPIYADDQIVRVSVIMEAPSTMDRGYSLKQIVTNKQAMAATGHSYEAVVTEPTCTEEGYTTFTCLNCGDSYTETIAPTGHSFGDWVVDTEPDCFNGGLKVHSCACGETETEILPVTSANCPSADYSDLNPDLWYHEGVDFALKNGLMNGVGEGKFDPDGALTRAQLVTILYRLAGEPEGLENPFKDVADGTWYTEAVIWAASEGIVKGVTETTFAPDSLTTREQIATILYRYSGAEALTEDALAAFTDADQISPWAWAVTEGILTGMSETTLAPGSEATRAQFATMIMRYAK